MRIIGGEARGRSICLPRGYRIRPTTDRIKESLFNILNPVEGAFFLDMFAGCGNIGLEALSRGARAAVFVEKSPALADVIRRNIHLLGFDGRAEIIVADAGSPIRHLTENRERFDILFADPPYEEGFLLKCLNWLDEGDILVPNGVVVLQHSLREAMEGMHAKTLMVTDQRRYGETMLSFLQRRGEE